MWVNRKGKYPYVSRDTWTTRVWLLIRKVDRQRGISSFSDRRVAIEMLRLAPQGAPAGLMLHLEEVITSAAEEHPWNPSPGGSSPEEGVGQEPARADRDHSNWDRQ